MLIKIVNKGTNSGLKTAKSLYLFDQKLVLCGNFLSCAKVWGKRNFHDFETFFAVSSLNKKNPNKLLSWFTKYRTSKTTSWTQTQYKQLFKQNFTPTINVTASRVYMKTQPFVNSINWNIKTYSKSKKC